jgi:chromosome segregation ATPase
MKKIFFALTMIACTSMLHSSSANLKKELSKEELTIRVNALKTELDQKLAILTFDNFTTTNSDFLKLLQNTLTQHSNDIHNACGRIKTLEGAVPTLSESTGEQIQAVIARLQALEEKSKKDATDFCQLATNALNRIEDLDKAMKDLPQSTLKTPTELQQLNDRVNALEKEPKLSDRLEALEKELTLSKSHITRIRSLIFIMKATGTICAIMYAAEQIDESKNLKNIACAFLRGLIPSRIFPTSAVPVATPPTNT